MTSAAPFQTATASLGCGLVFGAYRKPVHLFCQHITCRSKLWIACSDLFYMSERAHAAAPPFQTEPAYAGLRFGAALCAAFFLSVLTVCSKFESHVLAN